MHRNTLLLDIVAALALMAVATMVGAVLGVWLLPQ
jgi:hypothetical protein